MTVSYPSGLDLDDPFDFDRSPKRQCRHANGRAGMLAFVAENADDEVRRAVRNG